ncbi:MAG TPA: sulfide/dihydroorotate dehydrogenase-like FAD/NAD-binding protein [Chitinivibrionales bacterium]|nr:sulfide/dihydroorotate dehydrogenase-like FAD/NAD-binding protein [Chitinivibrionales bacterium]
MPKILKKEQLSDLVYRYRVDAPRIARMRRAGQFIILRATTEGERVPLTIANADGREGWIEIIFQVVGKSTKILSILREGDEIIDLAGPLGRPTHIENYGRCLCIGGGVGIAPLFPIVTALKEAGNDIIAILGARSANLLLLESEMKQQADTLIITTDDGTKGIRGFAADVVKKLLADGEKFDFSVVIGPAIMMRVTSAVTVAAGIKTYVSLNPIMIDGTGMCGGCRVTVGGVTKFACVDGPEFDASKIDWDEMMKRLNGYRMFEKNAMERHNCIITGRPA